MNIQEYLKQCSVSSIDELTDEQVVAFFKEPDVYVGQKCAVRDALLFGENRGFSKEEIMTSIRKSLKTGADFGITFVTGESAIGPTNSNDRWVMEP